MRGGRCSNKRWGGINRTLCQHAWATTGRSAQDFCRAHGFVRNLADGFYHSAASSMDDPREFHPPLLMWAWDDLMARLLVS